MRKCDAKFFCQRGDVLSSDTCLQSRTEERARCLRDRPNQCAGRWSVRWRILLPTPARFESVFSCGLAHILCSWCHVSLLPPFSSCCVDRRGERSDCVFYGASLSARPKIPHRCKPSRTALRHTRRHTAVECELWWLGAIEYNMWTVKPDGSRVQPSLVFCHHCWPCA